MHQVRNVVFIATLLFFVSLLIFFCSSSRAADVSLKWDANSESTLAGYRMYYKRAASQDDGGAPYEGTGIDQGDSPIDIPLESLQDESSPRLDLTGLSTGTYIFVVTAYDDVGSESGYSNEAHQSYRPDDPVNLRFIIDVSLQGEVTIRSVN